MKAAEELIEKIRKRHPSRYQAWHCEMSWIDRTIRSAVLGIQREAYETGYENGGQFAHNGSHCDVTRDIEEQFAAYLKQESDD